METQHCNLGDEWIGYKAIEVNLSDASIIEVVCGNFREVINVENPEGKFFSASGNLLQKAENSPDNIALFGNMPPKLFLRSKPIGEFAFLDNVRIRISGNGINGHQTRMASSVDLVSASQIEVGQIVIDLGQLIPLADMPWRDDGYSVVYTENERRIISSGGYRIYGGSGNKTEEP